MAGQTLCRTRPSGMSSKVVTFFTLDGENIDRRHMANHSPRSFAVPGCPPNRSGIGGSAGVSASTLGPPPSVHGHVVHDRAAHGRLEPAAQQPRDEPKSGHCSSVSAEVGWQGACSGDGCATTLLHLPIEAFALPLAVTGLNSRWRLACGFYLSSLLGTACTDLMMLATGVMPFWPQVVSAPLHEAGLQLHGAAIQLMRPQSLILLASAASGILLTARLLRQRSQADPDVQDVSGMAASVLTTTLWVDGLFLAAACCSQGSVA